jgi:anthraniloyl-CoA monooxygenase
MSLPTGRMNIACVGAGPASLYFSILAQRSNPSSRITVFERQPEGAALGWGVSIAFEGLDASDEVSAREIRNQIAPWLDIIVDMDGFVPVSIGRGADSGRGLSRSTLLAILTARAREVGVDLCFEREIRDVAQLAEYDLIVAGDGVNSSLRDAQREVFGTTCSVGSNKFIWLGTTQLFDVFTFAFARTDAGWVWAHAYRYEAAASSFIVEMSGDTWLRLGFDGLPPAETKLRLERIFARWLGAHPLLMQLRTPHVAPWLNFQTIVNTRWHAGKVVLLGDAAHTTHFAIGSGTRLAMADAISLANQLRAHPNIGAAFEAYERDRKASVRHTQVEARRSQEWFEDVPRYIDRDASQFARLLDARGSSLQSHLPPRAFLAVRDAMSRFPRVSRVGRRAWHALLETR